MKASKKGTPIGITDSSYHPIKVGDSLSDPDTHGTLTVDRFGRIIDIAGTVKPAKDNYYRILPQRKHPAPVDPTPKSEPEKKLPESLPDPASQEAEPVEAKAPEIEPVVITAEEPGKDAVNPLAGFPDRDLANELRRRGYQVTAVRCYVTSTIL